MQLYSCFLVINICFYLFSFVAIHTINFETVSEKSSSANISLFFIFISIPFALLRHKTL